MIIVAANAKGGVGKTSLIIHLACLLADREKSVEVIDLDRQASATDWDERATEADTPLPFSVSVAVPRQLGRIVGRLESADVILIDTPPGDPEAISAAIDVADFVVVPTRAQTADISRAEATLEAAQHKPHAILLTFTRTGTKALDTAREILRANDSSFFESAIPLRESIGNAYGTRPKKINEYESVLNEILEAVS